MTSDEKESHFRTRKIIYIYIYGINCTVEFRWYVDFHNIISLALRVLMTFRTHLLILLFIHWPWGYKTSDEMSHLTLHSSPWRDNICRLLSLRISTPDLSFPLNLGSPWLRLPVILIVCGRLLRRWKGRDHIWHPGERSAGAGRCFRWVSSPWNLARDTCQIFTRGKQASGCMKTQTLRH